MFSCPRVRIIRKQVSYLSSVTFFTLFFRIAKIMQTESNIFYKNVFFLKK